MVQTYTKHESESCEQMNQNMVIILGMHRSGTSLIANILSSAGFYVGDDSDLMKTGSQWNQNGYFERWSVVRANNIILHYCDGGWHDPPREDKMLKLNMDYRIKDLLKVYHGHPLALIKDPRMCLTLPVWKKILGNNVRYIHVMRKSNAVAASLKRRDGFSQEKSYYLYQIYNKRIFKYTMGYPVFPIRYDDLFQDARDEILYKLAAFLEVETDLKEIAAQVIDPQLRHFGKEESDLKLLSGNNMDVQSEYKNASYLAFENRNDDAIKVLENLLKYAPDHALANNDLGVLYYQKGRLEEALKFITRSRSLDSFNITSKQNLKQILLELERYRNESRHDSASCKRSSSYSPELESLVS